MALDNFRTQKIIWDRANKKIFEAIEANSGDSNGRKLVVQVINQETTESLSGTTLSLGWKSRNGAKGLDAFNVVDASKGIFEIYYTTEMLSNIGNIEASLILINSTSRIESSTFTISVRPSIVDDESIESENSFTALTEALVKVNDFDAQLAQKADRSQVDTFEARMEHIIQSSDLDPNKDQEVVDARLGKPTLGSKIQEMDELSEYYAGSGVGLSSGKTLAWERGSLHAADGSLLNSTVAIRTSDYFYVEKGNVIFLPDPRYAFTVLEYKSEDNYVGVSMSDVNSYTIGKQQNLLKIIIKRKDGTEIHPSEIIDVSGKLLFSNNEGIFNHIKKEINLNRSNLISQSGEDYTWESGSYRIDDGRPVDFIGRIRTVDYLEVDKDDIISTASSFDYYAIMYDHEFNMIDSIREYRREDYVIENEAVKYIRPVIKINNSTEVTPMETEDATSSFGVYKRTKDIFKDIKKEINLSRVNPISHEGEDYTWISGSYSVEDGHALGTVGRITTVDYLEVDKDDIISIDSSFDYYAIMYDHEFNMIDSIREYRREDYVIENEAVKYIRPVIKHNDSYRLSPQETKYTSTFFRVYKSAKVVFKDQNLGTGRGYKVRISGIATPNQTISSKGQNEPILSAIKLEDGVAKGYLYHGDNSGDGLYYSSNKLDVLEKIGELDFNPRNYLSIIGDNGEIIWVHEGARAVKPRIHVGDYNQSSQIETEITPISWLQNCGIDYGEDENGEFLIFGEYIGVRVGEIHLWKVRKPYNDPSNWKIVKTVKQSIGHRQGTVDEAWHFHTVQRDPYTNHWYATSGDSDLESKWWYSTDNGESWELLVDHTQWESQVARVLNFVFTEDYIYWANDYGINHSLNRVKRNVETGVIDPSTRVKLAELNKLQSTYATILTHSPAGILMLDRVDGEFSGQTGELAIEFWNFDDERLNILSKIKRLKSNPNKPFGFRGKAYTLNQGIYDTRLAIGFSDVNPNLLDIEGNNSSGRKTVLLEIF